MINYVAIIDAPFLDWLAAHSDALLGGDADALSEAIARSCPHKAAIVERDPFEHGERALLNFGPTFGHPSETAQEYCTLTDRAAVAIGLLRAARLLPALGLATHPSPHHPATAAARLGLRKNLPHRLDTPPRPPH